MTDSAPIYHLLIQNVPTHWKNSLDKNLVYVITPEGELRSELAVYLMPQARIEAYYMYQGLQSSLPTPQCKIIS